MLNPKGMGSNSQTAARTHVTHLARGLENLQKYSSESPEPLRQIALFRNRDIGRFARA
jgi:hypothetical protein